MIVNCKHDQIYLYENIFLLKVICNNFLKFGNILYIVSIRIK